MTVRFGLAGLGVHGTRYANHLLHGDVEGASLAAVSRRNETLGREFAKVHGVRFSADPLELCTMPGVDAVVLALPPEHHASLALACIETGRPVFVEKPLACDARSAAGVAREAARTGVPLMVGQTLRFDAVVQALRREAGKLGALRMVAINQRLEPFNKPWFDIPGPGGVMLNTGVHGFDLLRYLTGAEPVTVQAEQGSVGTRRTEDQFVAAIRLEPHGVLATLDNSRATQGRSGRIELVGERGQLVGDHIHRTLERIQGWSSIELGPVPHFPTVPEALKHFVDCLVQGREPAVSARDGLIAIEMLEAARLSAREGRRVELDEIRKACRTVSPDPDGSPR